MKQGLELTGVVRLVDGETHLSDLSMTFEPGSVTVLLGRTRAGKTSLLRVLAGLDRPSQGAMHWNGVDVTHAELRSRDVAMVYQQFVNYPSLTVYDNIASPLRLRKLERAEIDRRVREAAALLRIERLLDRLPAELSGGQQQRTAIARAIVKRAGLVLLDEPLANLDYKLREELRSELRELFRANPAVVVYATAEPSEALILGGRSAVIDEGRLLQLGPALDVYQAPHTARVGQVFSDPEMNLIPVELTQAGLARLNEQVSLALGSGFPALAPGAYRLGIRANHVRLARASERDLRIPARVSAQEISGSETLLHAAAGALSITAHAPGVLRYGLGDPVELFVAPEHLFVFDREGKLVVRAGAAASASSLISASSAAFRGAN